MILSSIQRLIHIAAVLLGHALAHYAPSLVRRLRWIERRLPSLDFTGPERAREICQDLGGAFLKFGQTMAMMPDIVPTSVCNQLVDLLDHVTPVRSDEIIRVIREETGRGPDDLFERFDPVPIASGSIGQVHVAYLEGRKLAIKVQRPDAKANFDRDIKFMRLVVFLVQTFRIRTLGFLIDPLSEFAAWTDEELDFRGEARHMDTVRRDSRSSERQYIPFVVSEYTSRRLLVVEFMEGITLLEHMRALIREDPTHRDRLDAIRFDPDTFARNVIDNYLGGVFELGIFHADQHPANLVLLPDNVIGYIDFGITGSISKYSRQNLLAMTLAYARKDLDGLCDRFFDVASLDGNSDPVAFREGVKRLSERWYAGESADSRLTTTTTQVMLDMARLSREARIIPQRDVVKYIRTSIAIDGIIRRFVPGFDFGHYLGTACRRHLTWHARRMLVSHEAVVDGAKAGVDLLRNGVFRLAAALEHVSQAPARAVDPHAAPRGHPADEWPFLLVMIASLGLAFGTHEAIRLGPNLATAEFLVAAAAASKLFAARKARLLGVTSQH
jgi:ubiquinone biosynthesis protein